MAKQVSYKKPNLIQAVVEVYVMSTKTESSWLLFSLMNACRNESACRFCPAAFPVYNVQLVQLQKSGCAEQAQLCRETLFVRRVYFEFTTTNLNNDLTLFLVGTAQYECKVRPMFREIATELPGINPTHTDADGCRFNYFR